MGRVVAHIALGSNLGDRAATLMEAIKGLAEHARIRMGRVSQFVATEPVGPPEGQPTYLNAAVQIETTLTPQELLAALHEIEGLLGRRRDPQDRWGPRTCDLDILLIGELVLETDELTIPHPRMHKRRFVLEPLAGIAPDVVHPVLGKTISELLAEAE